MEGIKLLAFAIFVTMLTTPLIRGPEYQLSTGPIVGGWRRTTNFIRYPVRYLGMPIPYCSNSIACFQLAIVLSGDVELNPGPIEGTRQTKLVFRKSDIDCEQD